MDRLKALPTNPIAMAGLGLLSMPTRSRTPINPVAYAMGGMSSAFQNQQVQQQMEAERAQRAQQDAEHRLRVAEYTRKVQAENDALVRQGKTREAYQAYLGGITDPNRRAAAAAVPESEWGKVLANELEFKKPSYIERKEGDVINTYLQNPDGSETRVSSSPRFNPNAGTSVELKIPPQVPPPSRGFAYVDPTKPELGQAVIPGGPEDGRVKDRQDTRKAVIGLDDLDFVIDQMKTGLTTHGIELMPGKTKAMLATRFANLQSQLRSLYNTEPAVAAAQPVQHGRPAARRTAIPGPCSAGPDRARGALQGRSAGHPGAARRAGAVRGRQAPALQHAHSGGGACYPDVRGPE
jgi:hypothetical protein